jgi:hypothetical protein
MEKKIRLALFLVVIIIGIILIKIGLGYALSRFDTGIRPGDNILEIYGFRIGYALIALSPIIIKRAMWTIILVGVALIYYAWILFAS